MYLIAKKFHFSAGHSLNGLPRDHPCSRDHGHNYTVRVALAATTLDDTGFVADFHRLAPVKQYIEDTLDHRVLNDVVPFQPSSERLAQHLFQWCQDNLEPEVARHLHHTSVSETDNTWAIYAPGDVAIPLWGLHEEAA
ncbi:6-carboxytetrahydropterin synthase QueD [Amycolatopsis sp. NPDC059021]|uniref:6-carboxytetrahydropterin synthase QueD n=1 Tax=Amycolatopsis sp. NPDC059021 TaxID=3346704 RepID=UPI0036733E13